jgi:5,10-methylenetetrahydromethanopterin reductase
MAGTVDDVAAQMAAVTDHADSIVVGSPLGPDLEDAVELAAEAYEQATN